MPNERDTERLVAEFHARGGQVTFCSPAEDTAGGSEQAGSKGGKTSTACRP
jgi:hypothetical protein